MVSFFCMKNLIYDSVLVLDLSANSISHVKSVIGGKIEISQYIHNILQYGLSGRVMGIYGLEIPSIFSPFGRVAFGLLFEPDQVFRLVDRGPSPVEDPAAAESFRTFWGPTKSQLRKFQNTNVIECVVWDTPAIKNDRSNVLKVMIQHMLEMHLRLSSNQIHLHGLELLPLSEIISQPLDKTDGSSLLHHSLTKLKELLMGVESALAIQSIVPLSSSLRGSIYVDFPRLADPNAYLTSFKDQAEFRQAFIPVHSVLLILETSNRWPKEPKAFHAMATAFLGNLATGLQRAVPESIIPSISTNGTGPSFMDVFVGGFIFRCYLDLGFAFPQAANGLSLTREAISLHPREEAGQSSARIHLSLWKESNEFFTSKSAVMDWLTKCDEFSFLIFSEALVHDSFVKNSIYVMHPKPVLDGMKLLLLWVSNKRLGDFFSFESIEKIVIASNVRRPLSKDEGHSSTGKAYQMAVFDPLAKPKREDPHELETLPTSSTAAFINAIYFLSQQENESTLLQMGISTKGIHIIAQLALDSLSVATPLLISTQKPAFSVEFLLLEMFRINGSFDFCISFESGRFLSDIRASIMEDMKGIKQTQEDILSSVMLPGFNPLAMVIESIKVSLSRIIILIS